MDYQPKRQLVVELLSAMAESGMLDEQVALDCGVGLRTVQRIKSKLRFGSSLDYSGRGPEIWPTWDVRKRPNVRKREGCGPVHQGQPETVNQARTRQRI